jgi:hypothetical protein
MPAFFTLEGLKTVSSNVAQDVHDAIDVLPYKTLTIYCRKPVAAAAGTLQLQHAATLNEDAFVDHGTGTVSLSSTTTAVITIQSTLRYLRWRTTSMSGTAQFMVDVVANEN